LTIRRRTQADARLAAPRVGLFGHLGACNIGNDASMEAVLRYITSSFPAAVVDAMCPGPETLKKQYGLDAIPMLWYHKHGQRASGLTAVLLKVLGRAIDAGRTAAWVRRHDVVIVPGAGVLEASLPLWPWGMPYSMFLLSVSGRLFNTKVAFVGVGAGEINNKVTRWLSNSAARLAFYRSYRDAGAREALLRRGLDTSQDHVYTDLAFALPAPPRDDSNGLSAPAVGVGVMAWFGSNDDRARANEIYSAYVDTMKVFVRWLVDSGRTVRLFVGDTNGSDDSVVQEILADLRQTRPDLDASRVLAESAVSFGDVMQAMDRCGTVVAIRYHNIVCSLKLAKPTISISYSPKHDVLMAQMGMGDFCLDVQGLRADELIKLFGELESRAPELRDVAERRNSANALLLDQQFQDLSAVLFPMNGRRVTAGQRASDTASL
jgi:polysaccharide pyruvyl transferase WcaK-like protein